MRRLVALAVVPALLAGGLLAAAHPASAAAPAYLRKVSPTNGWETPTYGQHYAFNITGELFSSAAVGDVTGDGVPEIVAGFPDGNVYVWRTDNGARVLSFWTGPGAVQASPLLVDLNHDGRLDVLAANTNGDVVGFTGAGQQLFRAKAGDGVHPLAGVFGTPAVTDLNNDGQLDVIATSWDHHIHAWRMDGSELPGFPVFLQDTSWSSPAIADIDGDGYKEIVFGYDCDGVPGQNCFPNPGGYVGVLRHDGSWQPGWPRYIPGQVVWSSPAVADIEGSGHPDIVVGTGNMPANSQGKPMGQSQVFAFRGDGSTVPGWPVSVGRNVTSSPAVGDLDGDGRADVSFVAEDGLLYGFRGDGSRLFARCTGNDYTLPPNGGPAGPGVCPVLHNSPVIADVFGTGHPQVVSGGEQWLNVFDAAGNVTGRGETVAGTAPMTAAPTVASVGGKTWIVEVTGVYDPVSRTEHGRVFAWTTDTGLGASPWPAFKNNMARTGSVDIPLTVVGEIANKYNALGGAGSFLGRPTSNQYPVPGGLGQHFVGGDIYWSAATGAQEVHGAILGKYASIGGAGSPLGLPTSDESAATGGRFNTFVGGVVGWSPATGAHEVHGLIGQHYLALGAAGSFLGFPTSDEYGVPNGRASNFAGGTIFWSPGSGAHESHGAILFRYQQLGGPASFLGFPTSDEGAAGAGRTNSFAGGAVYWSPGTWVHEVHGLILNHYLAVGGPTGALGFPTSDEYGLPGGRGSNFAGGTILWSPPSGAWAAQGALLWHYGQLGGPAGLLGYPVSDELAVPGGRASYFQGGRMYWSWPTGPREVHGAILGRYLADGGPGSASGLPVSDEFGVPGGRQSDFEHSSIHWDGRSYVVSVSPR